MQLIRRTINSLPDARQEISRLRQELQRTQNIHKRMLNTLSYPVTLQYLEQVIVNNPEYTQSLIQIAATLPQSIQSNINTIIQQAQDHYGRHESILLQNTAGEHARRREDVQHTQPSA